MINIGIVVGEFSGDKIATILIKNIISNNKKVRVIGVIGPELKNIGCESLFFMEEISVFGIIEPILKIKKLIEIREYIVKFFIKKIDIFIGIDFPGFNLNIEKKLKKNGIFVFHVISPSIWAWRKYRIKNMRFCFNVLMVIFPFEDKYYIDEKIPVSYIGHPCIEIICVKKKVKKRQFKKSIIVILPGSRISEIESHLLIFKRVIQKLKIYKNLVFIISSVSLNVYKIIKKKINIENLKVINKNFYKIIGISNIVFVASGTASLESSVLKDNTTIIYKINDVIYKILKKFIKIKYISLQNIISKKKIHKEYIQEKFNEKNIKNEIIRKQNLILIIKKRYLINRTKDSLKIDSKKKFFNFLENIILNI